MQVAQRVAVLFRGVPNLLTIVTKRVIQQRLKKTSERFREGTFVHEFFDGDHHCFWTAFVFT